MESFNIHIPELGGSPAMGFLSQLFKAGVSASRYARREKARSDKMKTKWRNFWEIVFGWIILLLIFWWGGGRDEVFLSQ